jgi:hypothetical protein
MQRDCESSKPKVRRGVKYEEDEAPRPSELSAALGLADPQRDGRP